MNQTNHATMQVLIVAPSPEEAARVQKLLVRGSEDAYDPVLACTGEAGLEILRSQRPDCVLLDFCMPDMDGLEFLSRLAQDHTTSTLPPIVVLIEDGNESPILETMRLGAQDYVLKSAITAESLRHAISNAIEKASLERRLSELERLRSEIITTVSSECRTPLSIIREFVSMVRDGLVGPITRAQTGCLSAALQYCDRLRNELTDALDLGWNTSGQGRLRRRKTDIGTLLKARSRELLSRFLMKYQKLTLQVDPDLPPALCDPERVGGMYSNLLGHANRFASAGAAITVRVKLEESTPASVLVEIVDTQPDVVRTGRADISDDPVANRPAHSDMPIESKPVLIDTRTVLSQYDGELRELDERWRLSRIAFTVPIYTDVTGMCAFVEDSRSAASAIGKTLSVIFVMIHTDDCGRTEQGREADSGILSRMKECIGSTLRRRDDATLAFGSEKMIIAVAEADKAGHEALIRRIELWIADEFGTKFPVTLSGGIIGPEDDIPAWIARVRAEGAPLCPASIGNRVLIIDEDDLVLDFMTKAIEFSELPLSISQANNSRDARRQYELIEPDLVILAINSVSYDPDDLLQWMTSQPHWDATRLLVVSDTSERFADMGTLGADTCLTKPLNLLVFIEHTTRLLGGNEPLVTRDSSDSCRT